MLDVVIILPPEGVTLDGARASIGRHGHHIYSVEAIKLEALDRKVEVVSGNTPHASSASTPAIIAKVLSSIKGVFGWRS